MCTRNSLNSDLWHMFNLSPTGGDTLFGIQSERSHRHYRSVLKPLLKHLS